MNKKIKFSLCWIIIHYWNNLDRRDHSLENLMEGHNWIFNQFVTDCLEINHCLLLISVVKSQFKPSYTVRDQLFMTTVSEKASLDLANIWFGRKASKLSLTTFTTVLLVIFWWPLPISRLWDPAFRDYRISIFPLLRRGPKYIHNIKDFPAHSLLRINLRLCFILPSERTEEENKTVTS